VTEQQNFLNASRAVVTVGHGRGFVVGDCIITAAHCLPWFPPCMAASHIEERTFRNILAPLGKKPTIWAECLFVDPIGDIAVLGSPDGQADLYQQATEYAAFIGSAESLGIEPAGNEGWLLSLSGDWFKCGIEQVNPAFPMWLNCPAEKIVGGMSGSPVISATGAAVGVVCASSESLSDVVVSQHGPNPALLQNLPGWFWPRIKGCGVSVRKTRGKPG
jgi:hypothetical protein